MKEIDFLTNSSNFHQHILVVNFLLVVNFIFEFEQFFYDVNDFYFHHNVLHFRLLLQANVNSFNFKQFIH